MAFTLETLICVCGLGDISAARTTQFLPQGITDNRFSHWFARQLFVGLVRTSPTRTPVCSTHIPQSKIRHELEICCRSVVPDRRLIVLRVCTGITHIFPHLVSFPRTPFTIFLSTLSAFFCIHTYLAVRKDADVVAVDGGRNEVAGVLEDVHLVVALLLRSRPHLMPAKGFRRKGLGVRMRAECLLYAARERRYLR